LKYHPAGRPDAHRGLHRRAGGGLILEVTMSTRASVIVKDQPYKLYFYQHCDGYPEGLGETLRKVLQDENVKRHKGDIEYLCGAIIMEVNRSYIERNESLPDLVPAVGIHGDEEYTYIINADTLDLKTIKGAREE
jgi:hypothetical protein